MYVPPIGDGAVLDERVCHDLNGERDGRHKENDRLRQCLRNVHGVDEDYGAEGQGKDHQDDHDHTAMASPKSKEYEAQKGNGEWNQHLPSTLINDGGLMRGFAKSKDHCGDGNKQRSCIERQTLHNQGFIFVLICANPMVDDPINQGRHHTIKDPWDVDQLSATVLVKHARIRDPEGTLIHEVPGSAAGIDHHLDLS